MSENNEENRVVVTLNGAYIDGPGGPVHAAPGNGDWVRRVRGGRQRGWRPRMEAVLPDGGAVVVVNEKFLPEGRWRLDGDVNPWDAIAEWLEGGE
tara:strand:- start:6922 stop:7206 length:285 start_codon:yes stop_codon:yes gene_type:complete